MALSNSTSARYVGTFGGKFTLKAKPGAEGARSRVNRNGVEVWEHTYDRLSGRITGVTMTSREHGGQTYDNLNIHLTDGGEDYILSVGQTSNVAGVFFQTMESIDYERPVDFSIWKDNEDKTAVVIYQNDQALKWKYTKSNPGQKPAWERYEINGKVLWDRSKEMAYYRDVLEGKIVPRIKGQQGSIVAAPQPSTPAPGAPPAFPTTSAATPAGAEAGDDLPF